MAFLPSLSTSELQHYHEVVTHSTRIRSHFDLLRWLQGDMQRYLPHDILMASWGDFESAELQFDVISPLPGVRSGNLDPESLGSVLKALHARWRQFACKPYTVESGSQGFRTQSTPATDPVGRALETMRSAIVCGIVDARGNHDCLYVVFHAQHQFQERERSALSVILPYIDTALRQIQHLPPQNSKNGAIIAAQQQNGSVVPAVSSMMQPHELSDRESQILHWVAMGKTNPEIAAILNISSFTVKNHMQRVFKKLDVKNRAQAVSKYRPNAFHVQD